MDRKCIEVMNFSGEEVPRFLFMFPWRHCKYSFIHLFFAFLPPLAVTDNFPYLPAAAIPKGISASVAALEEFYAHMTYAAGDEGTTWGIKSDRGRRPWTSYVHAPFKCAGFPRSVLAFTLDTACVGCARKLIVMYCPGCRLPNMRRV